MKAYLGGATTTPSDVALRKRLDRLAACFALVGYEFHELAGGEFLVRKFGLVQFCKNVDEAEAFARKAGAVK